MSSQQGKWREDQVLIICPGSQTTMAQLGCSELTPPAHRIPTRMFRDEDGEGYRPFRTYRRRKNGGAPSPPPHRSGGDGDVAKKAVGGDGGGGDDDDDDDYEWVEDRDSTEGAVYPLQGGRIVNMDAFLAFLDHVHGLLTTTYHNTPIVLMASPQWSRPDCEAIARYIFEKTKTPALCLLHSAVAAQYGLKWPTMTVVDIGFEKVDVTCIYDNQIVSQRDLGYPNPEREISGGEVFTRKLLKLLEDRSFTYDMAEQLKRSQLCEVLPYAPEQPSLMELPTEGGVAPLSAVAIADAARPVLGGGAVDGDFGNGEDKEVDDGVLDVANIVTSGNAREFIAKKEREKAERAKAKKAKGAAAALEAEQARAARLPNSKRKIGIFHYEDLVHEDVQVPVANGGGPVAQLEAAMAAAASETKPADGDVKPGESGDIATTSGVEEKPVAETSTTSAAAPAEPEETVTERRTKRVRRDLEVGLERFQFADRAEIDRIAETIYRAIQGVDEVYKRSGCWEHIVFVGNGSRLRGLKENILQTLTARHLISPSTATIFTSELPSNMATPTGTGAQTPTGSATGPLPTSSSVNPLLQAATTASMGIPGQVHAGPGSNAGGDAIMMQQQHSGSGGHHSSHHSHGQTPMNIKLATLPTYLAEWAKNGFEEANFLGSLVAARLAFTIHNLDMQATEAQRMMSLNRVDYNEFGPKAIRSHSMLGS
ncbi:actin-related protein 9 [Microdochium nivale]|nr:actin-related protein 9 [Microdochium nivale]